jgi:hypothetical protein
MATKAKSRIYVPKSKTQFLAYNLHVSISTNHVSAMVEAK